MECRHALKDVSTIGCHCHAGDVNPVDSRKDRIHERVAVEIENEELSARRTCHEHLFPGRAQLNVGLPVVKGRQDGSSRGVEHRSWKAESDTYRAVPSGVARDEWRF